MSVAGTIGEEQVITLATTVQLITGVGQARQLVLLESAVDVILVTKRGTADGAAVPATGSQPYEAADMPVVIDIAGYGLIGLAGESAGDLSFEFRL